MFGPTLVINSQFDGAFGLKMVWIFPTNTKKTFELALIFYLNYSLTNFFLYIFLKNIPK